MIPKKEEINKMIKVAEMIEKEHQKELEEMDRLGKYATPIYEKGVGRILIKAKNEEVYEYVQDYLLAELRALLWQDEVYLAPFEGAEVEDANGVRHPLETDLEMLKKHAGEPCSSRKS